MKAKPNIIPPEMYQICEVYDIPPPGVTKCENKIYIKVQNMFN